MSISVICGCGRTLKAPDNLAGKQARCPACKQPVMVPEVLGEYVENLEVIGVSEAAPGKTNAPQAAQKNSLKPDPAPEDIPGLVESGFKAETIEAVQLSLGYRLAALFVAVLMVLLPLLYLAIIALAAYGVWRHATENLWLLNTSGSGGGRANGKALVFSFMVYATPILAGGVMILFMLKPLFARALPNPGCRSLSPGEEPVLFDFVRRTCQAVGSPEPSRIDIDNEVNASASFRRGVFSFIGNDLVLTIGMPLAAGLTMRQFGGVLAHEFGHFSQGAGMRLSYVIRSINFWFHRVVHERDEWDERLKSWSSSFDFRVSWMLYAARFCVWLSRQVLWCLMMAGHFFSSVLMRQMEFDADRHEARFAGSGSFAETARRLRILAISTNGAMSDLSGFHREGRLCDNLPRLVLLNEEQMPVEVKEAIEAEIRDSRTGFFDTHPADSERIANAAGENTDGIFRLELPATLLFADFDARACQVTLDFYKRIFGESLKESDIHPVGELAQRQKFEQDSMKALARFFRGHFLYYRPFPRPEEASKSVTDAEAVANRLREARALAMENAPDYARARDKYDETDTRLIAAGLAENLLEIGLPVSRGDFKHDLSSKKALDEEKSKASSRRDKLAGLMEPFEAATAARLYSGVRLAQWPDHAPTLEAAGFTPGEVQGLVVLFQEFNRAITMVLTLRDDKLAMESVGGHLESHAGSNDKVVPRFQELFARVRGGVRAIRELFEKRPYPFDHAEKDISVGSFLVNEIPGEDDPGSIHSAAEEVVNKVGVLQVRVIARLCQAAEIVETNLGLEPLADPVASEIAAGVPDDD